MLNDHKHLRPNPVDSFLATLTRALSGAEPSTTQPRQHLTPAQAKRKAKSRAKSRVARRSRRVNRLAAKR